MINLREESEMDYTERDFLELIEGIRQKYQFQIEKRGDFAFEFNFSIDINFCRIAYSPDTSRIMIAFNVQSNQSECIIFYEYLKALYPKIVLVEIYYVDMDDRIHFGRDAEMMLYAEMEDHVLRRFLGELIEKGIQEAKVLLNYKMKSQNEGAKTPSFLKEDTEKAKDFLFRMDRIGGRYSN